MRATAAGALLGLVAAFGGAGGAGASVPRRSSGPSLITKRCTAANVLICSGKNRDALLVAGARREGQLVWYTTLRAAQLAQPLVNKFESLYPYIHVVLNVTSSGPELQTLEQLWSAGKYQADLVDGTTAPLALKALGDIQPFWSTELHAYPKYGLDLHNGLTYINADIDYYLTVAYNTQLVKGSLVPKSYNDLLKPAFRGHIAIGSSPGSGGPFFVGNILTAMGVKKGLAYLHKLAAQNLAVLGASAGGPAQVQDVGTGQYWLAINNFDDQVLLAQKAGQPVQNAFLPPVPASNGQIAIMNHAPDPDAAMLFVQFLTGKLGQTIMRNNGASPARGGLHPLDKILAPNSGHWKAQFIKPATAFNQSGKWQSIFGQLFEHV